METNLNAVVEAERSVLGAVFLESSVLDELIPLLDTDDFQIATHSLLWRSMKYLYNENIPVDLVTVSTALEKYKKLDAVGGIQYLTDLGNSVPSTSNVSHYAQIIKRNSLKRKVMTFAEDIKKVTLEDDFETNDEYLMLIDSMFSHMRPDTTGNMKSFAETEEEYFSFLVSTTENVLTGFKPFDDWSGGVGKGWLYILAGRPSVGKTAKGLRMARSMARQNIGPILFWSQEMTFNQLKNRILSAETSINYSKIRKKLLNPSEIHILHQRHKSLAKLPLLVEDSAGVTIEHIRATARQMKRKYGSVGAIYVDYLTRMNIKQEKGQTWTRAVGEVAKRFKWLAQEMNCPVILLAQLNREGAGGEPTIQTLRDSGEIEQEADVIEFLWRDPEDVSTQWIVVQSSIAKGRDVGVNRFRYMFDGPHQEFIDEFEEEGKYESISGVQSYQEDGSTFRKIPNNKRNSKNFPYGNG